MDTIAQLTRIAEHEFIIEFSNLCFSDEKVTFTFKHRTTCPGSTSWWIEVQLLPTLLNSANMGVAIRVKRTDSRIVVPKVKMAVSLTDKDRELRAFKHTQFFVPYAIEEPHNFKFLFPRFMLNFFSGEDFRFSVKMNIYECCNETAHFYCGCSNKSFKNQQEKELKYKRRY
ncbi:hypothetical protein CEXT_443161 [Caerostris extrusa]|uniref:Uncharacterized protein n=1 Tax=Caerostris extrusa TaxID=172846 RepID=A0AAV4SVL0_CAEEX|nr:hypothetical protein CEXT_443161 [Caerostris extrusa]